jgi:L-arabinose isomerase
MMEFKDKEVWFITGSQHLYGEETLKEVAAHSQIIAKFLNENDNIPVKVIFKPVVKTSEEILNLCMEANSIKNCIGLITWMHTFSSAKM